MENRIEGHGKLSFSYGYYEGEWKNGTKDGFGKYVLHGGEEYSGYWKQDKREGHGKLT